MKVIEKLVKKRDDPWGAEGATIAFLGDSVTQGCFEFLLKYPDSFETVFEYKSAFAAKVGEYLNLLFPTSQVNIINAGLSGDGAGQGAARVQRDVIARHPDLTVVSYGLNDSCAGKGGAGGYVENLRKIFTALKEDGEEIIFMTQNTFCTGVSPFITEWKQINFANRFSELSKEGVLELYFEEAKKLCAEMGVVVCDLNAAWVKMAQCGVNTTELLANKLNHPIRELHSYAAVKLVETMFEN